MRHTHGHTANRRSHHALKGARFTTCEKCGAKHLMHRVCGNCGSYRGRVVVDTTKKAVKAAKKAEGKMGSAPHTHAEELKETKTEKAAKAGKKTKKEEVAK